MQTDDNYEPFCRSQYEAPDGSYYESEDKYDTPLCIECDDVGCYRCDKTDYLEPDTGSDDDGGCAEWHYNDGEQHDDPPQARECPKCDGSGQYGTGTQAGFCYACKGKGWQDDTDVRRNAAYFRHNPNKR